MKIPSRNSKTRLTNKITSDVIKCIMLMCISVIYGEGKTGQWNLKGKTKIFNFNQK